MLHPMTPRSYLFVPADRPERYAKALDSGADAVIIDLEDAVAPDRKEAARQSLAQWLSSPAAREVSRGVVVRINSARPWMEADLAVCAAHAAVCGVMVPKAESATELMRVAQACSGKSLIALIETAWGFENRREVAAVPAVRRLAFGAIDFQADTGISGEGDALLCIRTGLVLASRLANLPPPIDGVAVAVEDTTQLHVDVRWVRQLGFGAKLCIHPRQVAVVNAGFSPSEQELAWARRVVKASEAAGGAAVAVDGRMVDLPVVLRARALMAQAEAQAR